MQEPSAEHGSDDRPPMLGGSQLVLISPLAKERARPSPARRQKRSQPICSAADPTRTNGVVMQAALRSSLADRRRPVWSLSQPESIATESIASGVRRAAVQLENPGLKTLSRPAPPPKPDEHHKIPQHESAGVRAELATGSPRPRTFLGVDFRSDPKASRLAGLSAHPERRASNKSCGQLHAAR